MGVVLRWPTAAPATAAGLAGAKLARAELSSPRSCAWVHQASLVAAASLDLGQRGAGPLACVTRGVPVITAAQRPRWRHHRFAGRRGSDIGNQCAQIWSFWGETKKNMRVMETHSVCNYARPVGALLWHTLC